MLRTIDIACDVLDHPCRQAGSGERTGWIIKRREIVQAQHAGGIVAQARAVAEAMLLEAGNHAQEEREAGFRQGLATGMQAAMAPLVDLLAQLQDLKEALRLEAVGCARSGMEDFLARAPELSALLDTVLASHLSRMPNPVWLKVPATTDVATLQAYCKQRGIDARIDTIREGGVFSAAWEGHLWEVRADNLCGPTRVGSSSLAASVSDAAAHDLCRDALLAQANRI